MTKKIDQLLDKIAALSPLAIALWLSVTLHMVTFAVKFEPEIKEMAKRLPSLEIVLVNAKTKNAPKKAELIAQANLDRGGNTDLDKQMKTALPAPKQKTPEIKLEKNRKAQASSQATRLQSKKTREERRVKELEKKAQDLLTQLNSEKTLKSQLVEKAAVTEPDEGKKKTISKKLNREALLAASLEMDRLEAQIAKQQEEYQKRPKRRFLGARAKAADDAYYLEQWRQKVERIGNMNYPAAARNQKIYGKLQLTVSIRSDGTIEKINIDRSSGSKVLDDAAVNIVRLAAPYAKFSKKMKKTTDILGITRTWTFTNEDSLSTQ